MDMDEKEYLESLRKRARRFKLKVLCDRRTDSYCIVNAENNYVIVPPPVNLPTVEAWLDDYEKEAVKE